ncbi:adenosylcobinamide-GDP ribazoletransferase [Actinoplanes sp. NPDC049599]|uniref:adenosylcobinamide-GDP ribazoletransferase n=1 Tax=Actinoplanes sp. NPDC049599 TaxID=3363903 RepID=UPI00379683E7
MRLAVTTLTVLPVRTGTVDRRSAAVAMSAAPLVGALLGAVLAGLFVLLGQGLVAATVTVAAGALLTRGLHLDGLADTVDALGSYRTGAAALAIMKKSDIGPFGVAAIALTLLIQAAALTEVGPWAIVAAWAAGRVAVPLACRRGVPAARPAGLGALVAATVPVPVVLLAAAVVAAGAVAAVPGRPWQGPAAVAGALLVTLLLLRHAVRRFGGITGDVLGAAVELTTTVTLVALTLG